MDSFIIRAVACLAFTGVGLIAMVLEDNIRYNDLCDSFLNCNGFPSLFEERLYEDPPDGSVLHSEALPE